jgi:Zinc carboxypeptidase
MAVRSQHFPSVRQGFVVALLLTASCASSATPPLPSVAPVSPTSSVASAEGPTTVPTTAASTTAAPPTASGDTTSPPPPPGVITSDVLAGISMTSVPPDVIVPTDATSLDQVTNPINGRRGGPRPLPEDLDCATGTTPTCLTGVLDMLGFDVTSGSGAGRERRIKRAMAVVQLDAGITMTGEPDDDLLRYLGIVPDVGADETRRIGTSVKGRPILAMRYGDGPRTVLVVGQTHGDEEGGLRVLLRMRSLPIPDEVTLWVVPTMNPDGLVADSRFLANGTDPNRHAPGEPEQQAVYDLAIATRPSLTVWYHQNYGWVGASGASVTPATQYQKLTGLGTLKHSGDCVVRGFMWCPIDDALGSSSILVELPDVLTSAEVQRHALALLAVASGNAP